MVSVRIVGVPHKFGKEDASRNVVLPRLYFSSPGSYTRVKIPGIKPVEARDWDADKCRIRSPRQGGKMNADSVKSYNEILELSLLNAGELIRRLMKEGNPTARAVAEAFTKQAAGDLGFDQSTPKEKTIGDLFTRKLEAMDPNEQARTIWRYQSICKKLVDYGDPKLSQVNNLFLMEYEHYLRTKLRNKDSTVNSNMKVIRSILIEAAQMGLVDRNEIERYEIPKKSESERIALTESEFERLRAVETGTGSVEFDVQQMFTFATMAGGMRFSDVATLTWRSIDGGLVVYRQSKTGKAASIPVYGAMSQILEHYSKTKGKNLNDPIFPFLTRHDLEADGSALRRRVSSANAVVNKVLKRLASMSDVNKELSFHMARHTFATIAVNRGANLVGVSKALRHSSLRETQEYLKSFSTEILMDPFDKIGEAMK